MKFVSRTKLMAVPHQIDTYTELRQQVHNDLRIQHPEWIEPDGESPMCDSYDARLIDQLDALTSKGDPTRLSLLLITESRVPASSIGYTRGKEIFQVNDGA
jgi:hypothetical protein